MYSLQEQSDWIVIIIRISQVIDWSLEQQSDKHNIYCFAQENNNPILIYKSNSTVWWPQ